MTEIPKVAWLPAQINYIPTQIGVTELRGIVLDIDCATFSYADHIANKLNRESDNGYYTALYMEL
jgi:hypothetical protein